MTTATWVLLEIAGCCRLADWSSVAVERRSVERLAKPAVLYQLGQTAIVVGAIAP